MGHKKSIMKSIYKISGLGLFLSSIIFPFSAAKANDLIPCNSTKDATPNGLYVWCVMADGKCKNGPVDNVPMDTPFKSDPEGAPVTLCVKTFGAESFAGCTNGQGAAPDKCSAAGVNAQKTLGCCLKRDQSNNAPKDCVVLNTQAAVAACKAGETTSNLLNWGLSGAVLSTLGTPQFQNDDCKKITGCPQAASAAPAGGSADVPFRPVTPVLQIPIPGVTFSQIQLQGQKGSRYIDIPFLAEYLQGMYKYAVGLLAMIAVVIFMAAGFMYIAARGDSGKIGQAKKLMGNAIFGLILGLGSYIILNSISPSFTSLTTLRTPYIERDTIDLSQVIDKGEPGATTGSSSGSGASKPISDTTYDTIFQKYAPCTGTDWRILKVIAYKESRLNPTIVNSLGFTGLFQFKKDTCPTSLGAKCNNLTDPDNNTAAGATMLKRNINLIKSSCPDATPKDFFTLLYMAHNSGSGAANCAMKDSCKIATSEKGPQTSVTTGGGCTADKIKNGIIAFWANHWKNKFVNNRGPRTYDFSAATADLILAQGVTQTTVQSPGNCPL